MGGRGHGGGRIDGVDPPQSVHVRSSHSPGVWAAATWAAATTVTASARSRRSRASRPSYCMRGRSRHRSGNSDDIRLRTRGQEATACARSRRSRASSLPRCTRGHTHRRSGSSQGSPNCNPWAEMEGPLALLHSRRSRASSLTRCMLGRSGRRSGSLGCIRWRTKVPAMMVAKGANSLPNRTSKDSHCTMRHTCHP